MKSLHASFNQGLAEGWATFWAPMMYIARLVKKFFVR
jgi:hypothetical protein